jgi:predicted Zn-dependent protease
MATLGENECFAVLQNGRAPRNIAVIARLDGGRLHIRNGKENIALDWPVKKLRRIGDNQQAGALRLALGRGDERVVLRHAQFRARLEEAAPQLRARGLSAFQRGAMFAAAGIAAVSFVLLTMLAAMPRGAEALLERIPLAIEERVGDRLYEQTIAFLANRTDTEGNEFLVCEAMEGSIVLDLAHIRLVPEGWADRRFSYTVISAPIPNAFTLPGGHIIITKGLFDFVEEGDEVTGILAHEIAHVAARDPLRLLAQTNMVSFLLGLIAGDFGGSSLLVTVADIAIHQNASRDVEHRADALAVALLRAAGIRVEPFARFMDRLLESGMELEHAGWLDSHPPAGERAGRIRALAGENEPDPFLIEDDIAMLRAICRDARPIIEAQTDS